MRGANHSMNVDDRIGQRSLINQAATRPIVNVERPRILKVQAGPTCCITAFIERLIAIPPRPPPAQTIPLARPRFLLKYCAGVTLMTWQSQRLSL